MEVHNQYTDKVDWTSYIMGCLAGIAPWIFIFINLIGDGVATDANPQGVPQFVRLLTQYQVARCSNQFALSQ
jgi:hypothetical protein